jgi:hypothetical protein
VFVRKFKICAKAFLNYYSVCMCSNLIKLSLIIGHEGKFWRKKNCDNEVGGPPIDLADFWIRVI